MKRLMYLAAVLVLALPGSGLVQASTAHTLPTASFATAASQPDPNMIQPLDGTTMYPKVNGLVVANTNAAFSYTWVNGPCCALSFAAKFQNQQNFVTYDYNDNQCQFGCGSGGHCFTHGFSTANIPWRYWVQQTNGGASPYVAFTTASSGNSGSC